MCFRRIFVDCENCRLSSLFTDETVYDAHCGVPDCTVGNAANRHEQIEHLEGVREERDRCPLCIQYDATEPFTGGFAPPGSSHMYMAQGGDNMTAAWDATELFAGGPAPLGSSHMYMGQGGDNMTAAREPGYQVAQGTGPAGQEWGNLAAPHQQAPQQSQEPEQEITRKYRQSKDDKCDNCRTRRRHCDVLSHSGQGIECSSCANYRGLCTFQGRTLAPNVSIRGVMPKGRQNTSVLQENNPQPLRPLLPKPGHPTISAPLGQ